ncbi:MAG: hypothetical protein JWM34_2071 [Ilumatobacteraceae bacterium]|nr:hypothetical protein [Ilumatobacteraceae bacterium]
MTPIEVSARRVLAWLRTDRAARLAFFVALVASLGVYAFIGRHQWFTRDDWASLITRPAARTQEGLGNFLFKPQDGHWLTVPVLLYDTLRRTVGLGSYWPFLLPTLATHVAAVLLVRILCLRHGVSAWTTTLLCTMLLVFGAGWENLVFAIQTSYNLSLVGFLLQLVLVDHDGPVDRRDYAAAVLVLIGLMSSGFGPIFMVGIFVVLALRQRWKALLVALVPQAVAYAWWYLAWARHDVSNVPVGNRSQVPAFVARGVGATFDALTAFPGLGAIAIVASLAVALSWRFGNRTQSVLVGLCATVVVMFSAIGFQRVGLGVASAAESRYVHVAAFLVVPAFGLAVDRLARIAREARWAGLGVLCAAIAVNVSTLVESSNHWAVLSGGERHTFELIAGSGRAGEVDPNRYIFLDSADVTVGSLASMVEQGALTPVVPVTDADNKVVADALGLPAPTP